MAAVTDDRGDETMMALRYWQTARIARQAARGSRHDWANAEMAVRFWAQEFRSARARDRAERARRRAAAPANGARPVIRAKADGSRKRGRSQLYDGRCM